MDDATTRNQQNVDTQESTATQQPTHTQEPVTTQQPTVTQQPVPSQEPATTQQPAAIQQPVQTREPVPMQQPATAQQPTHTQEPVTTQQPAVTQQPVPSQEPATTQQPAAIQQPVQTQEPATMQQPATAQQPAHSQEPVTTQQPAVTQQPVPSQEPATTQQPAAIQQPVQTQEPVTMQQPATAQQPVPSQEPTTTQQPATTQQSEHTQEPVTTQQPAITPQPTNVPEPATTQPVSTQEPAVAEKKESKLPSKLLNVGRLAGATKIPPRLPTFLGTFWVGGKGSYMAMFYINWLITIITLGLYSPWLKVKTKKYFYTHTRLYTSNFDFDAAGVGILITRVITVVLVGFILIMHYAVEINLLGFKFIGFVLLPIIPILIIRGYAFNARYTIWNNIRFKYTTRYASAFLHFFILTFPLLVTLALLAYFVIWGERKFLPFDMHELPFGTELFYGLVVYSFMTWPIFLWWRHTIKVNNLSLGKLHFTYTTPVIKYMTNHIFYIVSVVAIAYGIYDTIGDLIWDLDTWVYVLIGCLLYLLILVMFANYTHYFWNGIRTLDGSWVTTDFKPFHYATQVTAINHFLLLISVGLLYPVTRVRRWAFIAEHFNFVPSDDVRHDIDLTQDVEATIRADEVDVHSSEIDVGLI